MTYHSTMTDDHLEVCVRLATNKYCHQSKIKTINVQLYFAVVSSYSHERYINIEGMLKRVNVFINKDTFCNSINRPGVQNEL